MSKGYRRKPLHAIVLAAGAVLLGIDKTSAALANSEWQPDIENVPYWLGVSDNRQIDSRVSQLLAKDAVAVVLRADRKDFSAGSFSDIVERPRITGSDIPIFVYSWVSSFKNDRRIVSDIMNWLASNPDMQVRSSAGGGGG